MTQRFHASRSGGPRRQMMWPQLWLVFVVAVAGCQMTSGPRLLERLKASRPDRAYDRVVFRAGADADAASLDDLRRTLTTWTGPGADGRPRWHGVLDPHPTDLYERLLARIGDGARELTLVSYRYDALGMDVLTLVDYVDAEGERVGWDCVLYHEIPEPDGGSHFIGYDDLAWWEIPQMLLDAPVYLAIGVKEMAGEVVKSPFSAIGVGWLGTAVSGFSPFAWRCFERAGGAFIGDWADGWTALTWRFRARSRHTPVDLAVDLLGAVPLVGPIFDHKSPPDAPGRFAPETFVALGQGIHSGGDDEQNTAAWEGGVRELAPGADVVTLPYRNGGLADTVWSMFNLSSGMGYDVAERLVFGHGVRPDDGIVLIGFSGSVQRHVAATRALRHAGIPVRKNVGIAGPLTGCSCAAENHLLIGDNPWLDPVLLATHTIDLLFLPIATNVATHSVPDAGPHQTPWFPDPRTRAPQTGYVAALGEVLR